MGSWGQAFGERSRKMDEPMDIGPGSFCHPLSLVDAVSQSGDILVSYISGGLCVLVYQ